MSDWRTWFGVLKVIALGALAVGCGPGGQVKVYPVKGKVLFEGKPMQGGGGIAFIPMSEQAGKSAGGIVNADGTYVLGTYKESDGSMAGEFKVTVFQETVQEPKATKDGSAPAAGPVTTVTAENRIPLIYSNDFETPLRATVEAKVNEIDLQLKRQ